MEIMDKKDLKIIEILTKNARTPKVRIAKALEITETAVRKRISKLEKDGVILGYKAVINYKIAGLSASLTGLDVEPENIWLIVDKLKGFDEVKSIWLTTGDHMLMVEIVVKSVDDLSRIHEEIARMDGVRRVCPSIILDVMK
jgi:Lrp/AsnC family transcriptional regulator for asnA, asnC and gidA